MKLILAFVCGSLFVLLLAAEPLDWDRVMQQADAIEQQAVGTYQMAPYITGGELNGELTISTSVLRMDTRTGSVEKLSKGAWVPMK